MSTTIRIILGLAVNRDWHVRQIDVNTAFLQGHLKEEVFMSQPPGFQDPSKPTHVCHLRKALYGLKQAPRAWYSELKTYLTTIGFRNSLSDTSLSSLNTMVIMFIYSFMLTTYSSLAALLHWSNRSLMLLLASSPLRTWVISVTFLALKQSYRLVVYI